ncbi:hypothetical protein BJY04DRAFT_187296 [Aspergillus karnatakaensis]|uniref:uncharacterized protein n=1 Tax=Aspergillus karnatakaensis TaxID=1810916 RepID=UPI003CCC99D1
MYDFKFEEWIPNHRQKAFQLRLVSRTIRAIVDPVLYRRITPHSEDSVRNLCSTMIRRPEVAARVELIDVDEDEDYGGSDSESEESESGPGSGPEPMKEEKQKLLASATEPLKHRLGSDPRHAHALEYNNLDWLSQSTRRTRIWLLLLQLSNLKSLTLACHTDTFANMAMFLDLPRLEELYLPFNQLKYLKYEDMSGTGWWPVKHDAPILKRILEQHVSFIDIGQDAFG